ncbi:hypothetical protein [Bradyrhizobium sp. F1.13.3]
MSDLEAGFIAITVVVSDIDAMQSLDGDLAHFVDDRVICLASKR